ncbi:hypothetical protein ES703_57472 [subsurface metagenome]
MPIKINDLTLFDLKEISQKFGLSNDSIRSYIKEGKLKGRKFGVKWYVSARALDEYFSAPFEGAPQPHQKPAKKEREEPVKKETAIKKDPLVEELREIMKEKSLSANAAAKHIKTYPSQVIRWLEYQARPTPRYRRIIKRAIGRMKR